MNRSKELLEVYELNSKHAQLQEEDDNDSSDADDSDSGGNLEDVRPVCLPFLDTYAPR